MKLSLESELKPFAQRISIGEEVVLLGSCFSTDMATFFEDAGFKVHSNPFGVIFHPIPLAQNILDALNEHAPIRVLKRGSLFFSWCASGSIWSENESDLIDIIREKRRTLRQTLSQDQVKLIITFGTSYGYLRRDDGLMVANCHKISSNEFTKVFTDLSEMLSIWKHVIQELKKYNPTIGLYSTVSPVRHIKDGLVENSRSKSRLIELSHELISLNVEYIPSYEIIMDELRDYRFFERDLIHPNELARSYVWEKLSPLLLKDEQMGIIKEVQAYHKLLQHRTLYPGTAEDSQRLLNIKERHEQLLSRHPKLILRQ